MDLGRNCKSFYLKNSFLRLCRFLLQLELYRSSNHHVGKFLLIGVLGINSSYVFTFTEYGYSVGNCHDFVKFVGNEQNRLAFFCKTSHDLHEFVDFLRCQYCCRLVENKDIVISVQHLENFYSLLHTYCDILDLSVNVYAKTILFRQCHYFFSGFLLLEESERSNCLRSQNNIVHYRKDIDELEVLVYHSYSKGSSIIRIVDLYDLAILLDLACLRLIQSEKNAHQC